MALGATMERSEVTWAASRHIRSTGGCQPVGRAVEGTCVPRRPRERNNTRGGAPVRTTRSTGALSSQSRLPLQPERPSGGEGRVLAQGGRRRRVASAALGLSRHRRTHQVCPPTSRFLPVSAYDAAALVGRTQAAGRPLLIPSWRWWPAGFHRSLALLALALPGDEQATDDGYALHRTPPSTVSSKPPPRPSPRSASSPSTPLSRASSIIAPI